MTGPDLIVSSSKMDSTSTFAHTASINHLQIGGGDYDELGGTGPHNGSILFLRNFSFGFTIQQVQGERFPEISGHNSGTLLTTPHIRLQQFSTYRIFLMNL